MASDDGTVYTYARVSREDRSTGSCSLEWQHDVMQAWLVANRAISDGDFVDNGVSAAMPLDKRPQGGLLVAQAVHAGDVILIAKQDRMFRDTLDFCAHIKKWLDIGVCLVNVTEGTDCTTSHGRLIARIMVAVAEYERETIASRSQAGTEFRRERGLRTTAEPPYGWQHVPTGEKRKDGTAELRLEPHPLEQWAIQLMMALQKEGLSTRQIAAELTKGRHPTRSGRPWRHSTVADILRDPDHHLKDNPVAPPANKSTDDDERQTDSPSRKKK
jgi:DNA invertase Pin-like site-specific DNA recombinase